MGVDDQRYAPAALPGERPGTHCTGGWVDPRAGLDGCGKSRPPPAFDPRTVQPIASRYTDWATVAHSLGLVGEKNIFPSTPKEIETLLRFDQSVTSSLCRLRYAGSSVMIDLSSVSLFQTHVV